MSVFIIAELGSNWRLGSFKKDLQMAKILIDLAAESGVDGVKFQVFRAHSTYALGSLACPHLVEKGIQETIGEVFHDLEMPEEMIAKLASYCKEAGVAFMASTFSEETFHMVDPYVTIHKIASPELHDPTLLKLTAQSKKPTLLSTGLSSLEEIKWAVETFKKEGGGELTLLQCTVQYPTDPKAVHLHTLATLKEVFELSVGLSDHTRDPICAPVAATALGAKVVEKHVTLDNRLIGPDHSWAITGDELKEMVRKIRLTEVMLGEYEKEVLPEEKALRTFSRRSIQTICSISKGTCLQLGKNIAILRPGTQLQGLSPRYLEDVEGKAAVRDIEAGVGIQKQDYK